MEEIRHQFIGSLPMFTLLCTGLYTSHVVQDFFDQPYYLVWSHFGGEVDFEPSPKMATLQIVMESAVFFASGFLWPTLSGFPQVICASSSLRITGGI